MIARETIHYLLEFLLGENLAKMCVYGDASQSARLVIIPSGWFDAPIEAEMKGSIDNLPVCFGEPRVEYLEGKIVLYADVVAMAFYFLSRYEELLNSTRDSHGRFSAKDSFLGKYQLLNTPLLDRWSCWLRQQLGEVMPNQGRISKLYLTHDVDSPWDRNRLKGMLSRIKHGGWKNLWQCCRWVYDYVTKRDSVDIFDWLVAFDASIVKRVGERKCESIFFFLAPEKSSGPDSLYLNDKRFPTLFEKVNNVASWGLHTSYRAGKEMACVLNEVEHLKVATQSTTIRYNRHHYLRMTHPTDMHVLEKAGFTDDFSLAFADYAGFRTGTCRPYRWMNPQTMEVGTLILHPLTIMECSVTGKNYMDFNREKAYNYSRKLLEQVAMFGGECTLLWHNTSLTQVTGDWHRQWYCDMANEAAQFL